MYNLDKEHHVLIPFETLTKGNCIYAQINLSKVPLETLKRCIFYF